MFAADRLDRIDGPAFQFRSTFDIIIAGQTLLATGWPTFDALFRDVIEQTADALIDKLAAALPKSLPFAPGSTLLLKAAGRDRPRLRARVRGLLSKPYLSQLTLQQVQAEIARQQLHPAGFVSGGQLFVDPANPTRLVILLDEALHWGPFSKALFEVEHKAPL